MFKKISENYNFLILFCRYSYSKITELSTDLSYYFDFLLLVLYILIGL